MSDSPKQNLTDLRSWGFLFEAMNIHFNNQVALRSLADAAETPGKLLVDSRLPSMLEIRTGILLHADQEYETVLAEVDGILHDIEASISTH